MEQINYKLGDSWKLNTWDKDTDGTKYIAVNKYDSEIMIFLKKDLLSDEKWWVKVGVGLKSHQCITVTDKKYKLNVAIQKAEEFMNDINYCTWDSNSLKTDEKAHKIIQKHNTVTC